MNTVKITIEGLGAKLVREVDAELAGAYLASQGVPLDNPTAALEQVFADTVAPMLQKGLAHKHNLEKLALEESLKR